MELGTVSVELFFKHFEALDFAYLLIVLTIALLVRKMKDCHSDLGSRTLRSSFRFGAGKSTKKDTHSVSFAEGTKTQSFDDESSGEVSEQCPPRAEDGSSRGFRRKLCLAGKSTIKVILEYHLISFSNRFQEEQLFPPIPLNMSALGFRAAKALRKGPRISLTNEDGEDRHISGR